MHTWLGTTGCNSCTACATDRLVLRPSGEAHSSWLAPEQYSKGQAEPDAERQQCAPFMRVSSFERMVPQTPFSSTSDLLLVACGAKPTVYDLALQRDARHALWPPAP